MFKKYEIYDILNIQEKNIILFICYVILFDKIVHIIIKDSLLRKYDLSCK